jgi:ribosomal protein S18 acetylase RimI-like enzyme
MIRPFRESDRDRLKTITAAVFGPAAVDYYLERRFGVIQGHDWRWRKVRHIDDDIRNNAGRIFVYDEPARIVGGGVVGYITVTVDREAGIGRIPNLAVAAAAQGRGIGRALVEHALEYLRSEGMMFARVETLDGNAAGQFLYPALGFEEIVRQIYYVTRLRARPAVGRRLYVVARDHVRLYESLRTDLADAPGVDVVQDRRSGERRRSPGLAVYERRIADRRVHDVRRELERYGRAVVELEKAPVVDSWE